MPITDSDYALLLSPFLHSLQCKSYRCAPEGCPLTRLILLLHVANGRKGEITDRGEAAHWFANCGTLWKPSTTSTLLSEQLHSNCHPFFCVSDCPLKKLGQELMNNIEKGHVYDDPRLMEQAACYVLYGRMNYIPQDPNEVQKPWNSEWGTNNVGNRPNVVYGLEMEQVPSPEETQEISPRSRCQESMDLSTAVTAESLSAEDVGLVQETSTSQDRPLLGEADRQIVADNQEPVLMSPGSSVQSSLDEQADVGTTTALAGPYGGQQDHYSTGNAMAPGQQNTMFQENNPPAPHFPHFAVPYGLHFSYTDPAYQQHFGTGQDGPLTLPRPLPHQHPQAFSGHDLFREGKHLLAENTDPHLTAALKLARIHNIRERYVEWKSYPKPMRYKISNIHHKLTGFRLRES